LPKLKTTNRKPTPKKPITSQATLVCQMCDEQKSPNEFYASKDPIVKTGKIPICKQCIKQYCYVDGEIDIDRFKEVLGRVNKVFNSVLFESAKGTAGETIGKYFGMITTHTDDKVSVQKSQTKQVDDKKTKPVKKTDFEGRWMDKTYDEAVKLESFYQSMKKDNRIESAQDEIYLKNLAFINLEMEQAIRVNDWDKFKKLSEIFSKFMGDAKLRSMDKTEADRTGGLRSFGMIYAEVEKDGFIPPWKEYAKINGARQDIVDKTIMHIENFTLKLNKVNRMNTPPVDCPLLEDFEIDENATINDVGISELADEENGGDV